MGKSPGSASDPSMEVVEKKSAVLEALEDNVQSTKAADVMGRSSSEGEQCEVSRKLGWLAALSHRNMQPHQHVEIEKVSSSRFV